MLSRSKTSYRAAMLMMKHGHYDGCAVGFYYAVLQRMMYALASAKSRAIAYSNMNPLNEDLHKRVLREILNRIPSPQEEDAFERTFTKLLDFRKHADYQPTSLSEEECAECRALYEALIGKIDRFFHIESDVSG